MLLFCHAHYTVLLERAAKLFSRAEVVGEKRRENYGASQQQVGFCIP